MEVRVKYYYNLVPEGLCVASIWQVRIACLTGPISNHNYCSQLNTGVDNPPDGTAMFKAMEPGHCAQLQNPCALHYKATLYLYKAKQIYSY